MISLRQIEYFISVAETGQISKSAIDLHVSQSAITAAIKGLEDSLGTRLFVRHQKGVTLTYEGHHFLQHSKHIISSVEEAIRIPGQLNAKSHGNLNIAVSFTVAGYFFAAYYSRFTRSFPNISVKLKEASRNEIEEGLISGLFNLAIIITSNIINQEDLNYETLISSKRRLWTNVNHKFLEQPAVSLQDVAKEPYIMLTVDEASNTAQKYWNRTPFQPDVIFRTSSVEAVRSMVANGIGVSVLSDMVYRPWSLEGRRVETVNLTDDIPSMDIGLAWVSNRERTDAAKSFCNFMKLTVNSNQSNIRFPFK